MGVHKPTCAHYCIDAQWRLTATCQANLADAVLPHSVSKFCDPEAISLDMLCSCFAQVALGLPLPLGPSCLRKSQVPGRNTQSRRTVPAGMDAIRPKYRSCCSRTCPLSSLQPRMLRTSPFETRLQYEGLMPAMRRKHLW